MPKKILVIDDDPDILEILDIIFHQEGYEVVLSETGKEAERLHEINPDLVLLDIMLKGSGTNGGEICARIKSSPETSHLPVIMVSSEDNLKEVSDECGANAYISKPFKVSILINMVNELLAA